VPFKKGQGGRPRGAANKTTTATAHILTELGGPNGQKYADQLFTLATGVHSDPHVRIKALSLIAPYVWGKPTEHVKLEGTLNVNTRVVHEYHGE
jgi:hypothetical protein